MLILPNVFPKKNKLIHEHLSFYYRIATKHRLIHEHLSFYYRMATKHRLMATKHCLIYYQLRGFKQYWKSMAQVSDQMKPTWAQFSFEFKLQMNGTCV